MFSRDTVTINIGGSGVRTLTVKGGRIQGWGTRPLEPGAVKDGLIMDVASLGSAIASLLKPRARKRGRVIMALNGLRTTTRVLSFPLMRKGMYEEAIRREAIREMPLPEEELCLSWQAIDPGENEQGFFVVGVARDLFRKQVRALKQLGITLRLVETKSVALARVVNRQEALILDLEPEGFEIIMATDGIPRVTHRGPWRREATTPQGRVEHMVHELARALKFYSSTYPDSPIGPEIPAFLTGGLAVDPAIVELCRSKVEYTIEELAPPLEFPSDLPLPEYAVNLGLALKEMAPPRGTGRASFPLSALNVKLVDTSRSRTRIIKETVVVACIAAAALLLVPVERANRQFIYETGLMRAEVAVAGQKLELLQVEAEKAQTIRVALAETNSRAEALELAGTALEGTQTGFAGPLGVVMANLGEEDTLVSINMTTDRIMLKGRSDSITSVTGYADALLAKGGFTRVEITSLAMGAGEIPRVVFTIEVEI